MQWMQDHIANYIEQQIKNHLLAGAKPEVIDALDEVKVYLRGVQ
jgi:hypothetical protein